MYYLLYPKQDSVRELWNIVMKYHIGGHDACRLLA